MAPQAQRSAAYNNEKINFQPCTHSSIYIRLCVCVCVRVIIIFYTSIVCHSQGLPCEILCCQYRRAQTYKHIWTSYVCICMHRRVYIYTLSPKYVCVISISQCIFNSMCTYLSMFDDVCVHMFVWVYYLLGFPLHTFTSIQYLYTVWNFNHYPHILSTLNIQVVLNRVKSFGFTYCIPSRIDDKKYWNTVHFNPLLFIFCHWQYWGR